MKKLLATAALAATLALGAASPATAQADGNVISLQQADIRTFIEDVGIVTGYTLLVDPRVQGQVTVTSTDALTRGEVWEVFKDVLRNQGYTALRSGPGQYRITLLQGAPQDAPFVEGTNSSSMMGTTVITLQNVDAAEAAKLIKPVLHTQGVLTANPNGRIIVLTDFPENIVKAREIVRAMEAEISTMRTVRLTNLSSIDAEEALKALYGERANVRVVGVPSSNTVILEGQPGEVFKVERLLADLDSTTSSPRGAISVVPIRYGDGEQIAAVVASLLPGLATEGEPTPAVAYEPGSNTLIINAQGPLQGEIEGIVRRLDQRRPQVMVEAMIVEISDQMAKELGVQFALAGRDGSDVPFIGTNYSRQPGNILALTGAIVGEDLGFDTELAQTAAVNSLFNVDGGLAGGISLGSDLLFGIIINAIEQDTESNILSNPFFTTLDNVPANFLVGQEIPVVTGESFGQAGGLQNPFRTFDRQEVGLKLEILPQITEGDLLRLEIKNEVSSILGTATGGADFILNKRELGTTVLAKSGEIIVLGGLIQDDEQLEIDKVPILGDLPVVGNAFRSKGKTRSRTNLMVFLRPTILRSERDARPMTRRRLNQMRLIDQLQSGDEVSKFDRIIQEPSVLPQSTAPVEPTIPPTVLEPVGDEPSVRSRYGN